MVSARAPTRTPSHGLRVGNPHELNAYIDRESGPELWAAASPAVKDAAKSVHAKLSLCIPEDFNFMVVLGDEEPGMSLCFEDGAQSGSYHPIAISEDSSIEATLEATDFLKWLVANGRCTTNPLTNAAKVQTRGKQVRVRRASTFEELNRLLGVAGPRRVGYLAAFFTGLRRAELKALEWGDVHLDEECPFIAARAGTTKNGARAEIRLHPQLATELRDLRPTDAEASDSVLGRKNLTSMWMMRKDLESAGISFRDAQGRRVDFHSLRGSLNTHLAGKVDPQVRQKIMRHSDIKLTMDTYTDSSLLRVSEAITVLPSFDSYSHPCAHDLGTEGHGVSQTGTNRSEVNPPEVPENEVLSHELAQDGTKRQNSENGCLTRIRRQRKTL